MIKDIKYSGYSASPSDYESPDGELAAAVNLIPENGALHPVLPSKELFEVPSGYKLMFLHHPTQGVKNYILYNETTRKLAYTTGEGDTLTVVDIDTLVSGIELYKINAVGNTLVVLTSNGVYYYLWKAGAYIVLGNKIPEIFMNFSLKAEDAVTSDEIKIHISGRTSDEDAAKECTLDGVTFCNAYWMWAYFLAPYSLWEATPQTWRDSADFNSDAEKIVYSDAIKAKANPMIANSVTNKGKFCMPFFVRYAIRLYDDTLVKHSAPVLMLPDQILTTVLDNGDNDVNDKYSIQLSVNPCTLQYQLMQFDTTTFEKWKDIIKSVDIFISAPIWDYDQAGLCDKMLSGGYKRKSISKQLTAYTPIPSSGEGIIDWHNNSRPSVPQHDRETFAKSIEECANFYLLHSYTINELSSLSFTNYLTARTDIVVPDDYLQSLLTREVMSDDYQTHDSLIAKQSYNFNGRLNLTGLKRNLFNGYNPWAAICFSNNDSSEKNVSAYVEIYDEGRTMVVKHDAWLEIAGHNNLNLRFTPQGITWYFYPDSRAKRAVIKIGSSLYKLPLKPHQHLNGAYFFNSLTGPSTVSTEPTVTADNYISIPNKIYTSDVNNPFFFPLLGINTVGTGEIMGICAAVKPLSQGQAGQFPLYVFTTEGVWALSTNAEGKFVANTPATLDVCINQDSITQTEDSVLFATDRGIMLLTGNNAICITDVLDGKGADVFGELPSGHVAAIKNKAEALGLVSGSLNFVPFKTYVASAKLIYDYTHQRIILFNPNTSYNYAYVFSLESKAWGMMATNLVDSLNSYPNALAVDSDRHLLDMCQEVTEVEVSTPSAAPSTTPTTQSNPGASTSIGDPVTTEPSSGIAEPGEEYGGSGSSGTQSENTGESSSETSGDESTTTDETEEAEEATTTTVPVTVPAVLVTRPLKLELPEILKTVDRVIQRGRLNIHASGHVPVQSILYGSRDLYHWHMVKSSTDHQLRGFRGTPYKYFKIVLLCNLLPDESLYGASVSLEARYTNRPR